MKNIEKDKTLNIDKHRHTHTLGLKSMKIQKSHQEKFDQRWNLISGNGGKKQQLILL